MENHQHRPLCPAVSARLHVSSRPWWNAPMTLLPVGLAAVAIAFFVGYAVGESSASPNVPPSSTKGGNERPSSQRQDDQHAGVSPAQKSQPLSKLCE